MPRLNADVRYGYRLSRESVKTPRQPLAGEKNASAQRDNQSAEITEVDLDNVFEEPSRRRL